jgi:Fe-S-cluster-containing dehydrogenase component
MKQLALVFDADRCIGCRACRAACSLAHGDPLGVSRIKTYTMGPVGGFPRLKMYFLTVACQQCGDPACAKACPTGACLKSAEDGVVRIDGSACVSCGECARACPYGAIDMGGSRVFKCDLCADSGETPVCVSVCPGEALRVTDGETPENAHALRDEGGLRPSGRFILRRGDWIDELPADFEKKLREGRHDG